MTLNDYIKKREQETASNLLVISPFGLSTKGSYLSSWTMGLNRAQFYTRSFGVSEFSGSNFISIYVPRTDSGMVPAGENEQPFGWDGKINEYVAEQAVWWAFDLLTDAEALDFLKAHKPEVIFEFIYNSKPERLSTRFNGENWILV
ncbi:MAG: hypothetical protein GY754_25260 [bacterium]|nr:hypothetical protein [bacterium]